MTRTTVVLDTNALMMPVELDVRVFDELDRLLDGVPVAGTETQTGTRAGAGAGTAGAAATAPARPASEPDSDSPPAGDGVSSDADGAEGALDLAVPRAVVEELETLARGRGAEGVAASVGADLAARCRVVETEASYADDAVVELASTADYVVTNDKPLRDRLLERGVRVIGLRGRNKLSITEP